MGTRVGSPAVVVEREVQFGTLDDMLDDLPGSEEGVKVDVGFWDNVSSITFFLCRLDRLLISMVQMLMRESSSEVTSEVLMRLFESGIRSGVRDSLRRRQHDVLQLQRASLGLPLWYCTDESLGDSSMRGRDSRR